MSEKEYKDKCEMMFKKNAILINENAELKAKIENLKKTYRKQRNKRIDELQKKNAELKKDKEWLDNTNNEQTKVILELQAQIDQLSNDNHVLKTAFITQKEQIEKMKCCGNCKHLREKHNENCIFIKSLNTIVCNKWESAE